MNWSMNPMKLTMIMTVLTPQTAIFMNMTALVTTVSADDGQDDRAYDYDTGDDDTTDNGHIDDGFDHDNILNAPISDDASYDAPDINYWPAGVNKNEDNYNREPTRHTEDTKMQEWMTTQEYMTHKTIKVHEWMTHKTIKVHEWMTHKTINVQEWTTHKTINAQEWMTQKQEITQECYNQQRPTEGQRTHIT